MTISERQSLHSGHPGSYDAGSPSPPKTHFGEALKGVRKVSAADLRIQAPGAKGHFRRLRSRAHGKGAGDSRLQVWEHRPPGPHFRMSASAVRSRFNLEK